MWFTSLATFAFPKIHLVYPQILYLSNLSQQVSINGSLSREFSLDCGVPQGSCVGLLLFVIYTSPVSKVYRPSSLARSIGSFSNDDSDGNEDVKKAIGFITQNNNFARA